MFFSFNVPIWLEHHGENIDKVKHGSSIFSTDSTVQILLRTSRIRSQPPFHVPQRILVLDHCRFLCDRCLGFRLYIERVSMSTCDRRVRWCGRWSHRTNVDGHMTPCATFHPPPPLWVAIGFGHRAYVNVGHAGHLRLVDGWFRSPPRRVFGRYPFDRFLILVRSDAIHGCITFLSIRGFRTGIDLSFFLQAVLPPSPRPLCATVPSPAWSGPSSSIPTERGRVIEGEGG